MINNVAVDQIENSMNNVELDFMSGQLDNADDDSLIQKVNCCYYEPEHFVNSLKNIVPL